MRIFVLAAFLFVASFGTPFLASAQSCAGKNANDPCSYNGNTGTCIPVQAGTDIVLTCSASSGTVQIGPGGNNPTQTGPGGTNTGVTLLNPLKSGTSLSGFLTSILDFVITIGSIVVILMLVYVGYLFVIAQGKEAEIREARNALLWTVIGALILLGSKAIAVGVQATIRALGG